MADLRNEESKNYITIVGEVSGTRDKYAIAVNPTTGAMLVDTSGGGGGSTPSTLQSGTITIAATGVAEPLSASSVTLDDGVTVQNNLNNPNDVWVGDASVAIDNGILLTPGEAIPLAIDDLSKVYILGTISEKVNFIGG